MAVAALAVAATMTMVIAACVPPKPPGGGGGGTTIPPVEDAALAQFPVISGLSMANNVEFAPDGTVFIAEKAGVIKAFDDVEDTEPTIVADLNARVRNVGDHGLLGMALHPDYPTTPYLYAFYTWDITGRWGDGCTSGYGVNGCRTGARIERLELDANHQMVGSPLTIEEDRWCFQFSSHGVGDLEFLPDGTMLASAGEGAFWDGADHGQYGGQQFFPPHDYVTPRNPCGDPPNGEGGAVAPTTSEGGALRAQDVLTEGDPVWWNGGVVRIDPDTGEAPADNPLVGVGEVDDDAVVAHGMRNPFRFTVKPGTNEVYLVDVGFGRFEEINKVVVGEDGPLNMGWPCKEGPQIQPTYDALNNSLCDLALSPEARTELTDPWFAYLRGGQGAAITGLTYLPPTDKYPEELHDTLIFSDYVRQLTYSLAIDPDGTPSDASAVPVLEGGILVDLEAAPDGYLYALDYMSGSLVRIVDKDQVPVAQLEASTTHGPLPLTVELDASASSHTGEGDLTFDWDLDGDGEFGDASGATTSLTLTDAENRNVTVKVTNDLAASSTASITLYPGNTPPEVTLDVSSPLPWSANDEVTFAITAADAEDGPLPTASVSWAAEIHHCYSPDDCHMHPYTEATGSLGATIEGPSHGVPSFLKLVATAVDSRGQTTRVEQDLHPATVTLEITSTPPGALISIGDEQHRTPFTFEAVRNDSVSLAAPTPQEIEGVSHVFSAWDHGGAASQQYLASADGTIHATLTPGP
jgi:glucose/arabinose dehydrogenase